MKTTYNLVCLAFIGILYFSSCRQSTDSLLQEKPEPETLQSYLKFLRQDKKGMFTFASTGSLSGEKEDQPQVMEGHFSDKGRCFKGGKVKFGNHVLEPILNSFNNYTYDLGGRGTYGRNGRHAARDVFGTTISIELQVPVVSAVARVEGTKEVAGSLYIPKEIEGLAPVYNEKDSGTFILQEGFRIKWYEDAQNLKGVLIYLEYDPGFGTNNFTHKKNFPETVRKIINTKDVAEGYVFKNSDLAEMPNGSMVDLRITRGNYVVLKDGENNYDVLALTTRNDHFMVKVK